MMMQEHLERKPTFEDGTSNYILWLSYIKSFYKGNWYVNIYCHQMIKLRLMQIRLTQDFGILLWCG